MRLRTWLLSLVLLLALAAAPAGAQTAIPTTTSPVASSTTVPGVAPTTTLTTAVDFNALSRPETLDMIPAGHQISGRQALNTASRLKKIRQARADHPRSTSDVFMKGPLRWQVSF